MASLTLSQAALTRATVTRHGSSTTTPQQLTSLSTLQIPTFSGLKSTPPTSSRAVMSPATRRRVVTNAAVETLEKTETALVDKSVNTIRFLAIDAVEKANSGHPGFHSGSDSNSGIRSISVNALLG